LMHLTALNSGCSSALRVPMRKTIGWFSYFIKVILADEVMVPLKPIDLGNLFIWEGMNLQNSESSCYLVSERLSYPIMESISS
jgi:hypothetical protein